MFIVTKNYLGGIRVFSYSGVQDYIQPTSELGLQPD